MRGTAMGTAERKEMQRDGELMGETRISRTIIVIVQTVLPTTMLLENHLAYKQHDASILQIFLRCGGGGSNSSSNSSGRRVASGGKKREREKR